MKSREYRCFHLEDDPSLPEYRFVFHCAGVVVAVCDRCISGPHLVISQIGALPKKPKKRFVKKITRYD